MDKICQLELDAKNDKIADLQQQALLANIAKCCGNNNFGCCGN
jgi:hypothetical protein